jgi:membrane-associated protease RseP (regulator of RpoE activity)
MRQYELDKNQSLKSGKPFRLIVLKTLARTFNRPGKFRAAVLLALVGVGLLVGGLVLVFANQSPRQTVPTANPTAAVPQLGVLYISSQVAFKNLPVNPAIQGLVITEVKPGSPAHQAGILTGDVLTHLDGKGIQAEDSLLALLKQYQVGDRLTLGVYRDEKPLTITVVLA